MTKQDDEHAQLLDKLRHEVGPSEVKPHQGGYLTQNEYATLIYYWAAPETDKSPEVIDGVIATLANSGWARTPARELAATGAVLAFEELYPEKKAGWRRTYPALYKFCSSAIATPHHKAQWNDFHVVQWFILRGTRKDEAVDILDKMLDRVNEGGEVGYDARQHLEYWAVNCKPFALALQKARAARMDRMIVQ